MRKKDINGDRKEKGWEQRGKVVDREERRGKGERKNERKSEGGKGDMK